MSAPKIKICGITNLEDALFCSCAGADALGFIFFPKSPRYISFKKAWQITKALGLFVLKVGVFVDEDKYKAWDTACRLNLDIVQFHGSESPAYCRFFKKKFKVVKAFFPKKNEDLLILNEYDVDGHLLDVKFEDKKKFPDKTLAVNLFLKAKKMSPALIISGNLNLKNISYFVDKIRPYAVDVARGTESSPGKKDKKKVLGLVKAVKKISEVG